MFPLIPAILLLLLQGSPGFNRFPQANGLPYQWQTLKREASVRDVRAEAALVRFLAIAAGQQIIVAAAASPEPEAVPEKASVVIPAPASTGHPQEGSQDCRRSRDGPTSIG